MPKKTIDFEIPINVLIRDDGTKEALIAIAMMRGEGGSFAGPVRDALGSYVRNYAGGLSSADRKRYDEILESVKTNSVLKKQIQADGGGARSAGKIRRRPRSLTS